MEIVVNLAKTDTIYVNFATLVENSKERVSLLKLTPPNIVRWFRTMIFCRSLSHSLTHIHIHILACLKFGWMRFAIAIVVIMIIIKI